MFVMDTKGPLHSSPKNPSYATRVWGLFLHHSLQEMASSQNSLLLRDLCHIIRKPLLSYMDVNAAVLLHCVTHAVHAYSTMFSEMSPTQHQFCLVVSSTCFLHVPMRYDYHYTTMIDGIFIYRKDVWQCSSTGRQ
jgi:hypothetical protein